MDYMSVFEISASGLLLEKARMEAVAKNIANENVPAPSADTVYRPVRVTGSAITAADFSGYLNHFSQETLAAGVKVSAVDTATELPKKVYEPGHPYANAEGMVYYPAVDHLAEMVTMMSATRAYEANIKVINASKSMLQHALEIGSSK